MKIKNYAMTFGERLRKERLKRNLSLQDVADQVGVKKAAVWQWENRTNAENIKTKNMKALCDFFGQNEDYFIHGIVSHHIKEDPAQYGFDDMLSKCIKYVLIHAPQLNEDDTALACRLLYNKVKGKDFILASDLDEILLILD